MSDILADYREWAASREEPVGTHSGRCHLWHERCMIHRLAAELARLQADRTPGSHATPGDGSEQEVRSVDGTA